MQPSDTIAVHADLERLAAELTELGYQADLRTPASRPPFLEVRNPQASVLTERVYAEAGSYLYSWGEPIARCDQASSAAAILARVLRTAEGE